MRVFNLFYAVILILLGLLWSFQGAALIRIKPVLCLADCEPLVGGSTTWMIIGMVTIAVGVVLLVSSRRKRRV